jgi:hypothetical protein
MSELIRRLVSPSIQPDRGMPDFNADDLLAEIFADDNLDVPAGVAALPMPRDPFATLFADDVLEENAGSTAPLTQHVFGLDPDAPSGPIIPMGQLKTIEDFNTMAPRPDRQAQFGDLPARGSEVAIVDPHLALRQMYYDPLGLGDEVQKRMDSGAGVMNPRREYTDGVTFEPDYANPWLETQIRNDGYSYAEGVGGYHSAPRVGRLGPADKFIDVAAHGSDPKGTAAHEMRHAITKDDVFTSPLMPGVENAALALGDKAAQLQHSANLHSPQEVLAYSAEAIPLFAEKHGRLPTTDADADEAMRLIAEKKGEGSGQIGILSKAYQDDPATQDFIRKVMKTAYVGAPVAMAAGSAGTANAAQDNPLVDYSVGAKYLDPNEVRTAPWSPAEAEMGTEGYGRWSKMAPEIMSEPVISSKYMADQLGMDPEVAQGVFGDHISMGDFLTTYTRLTEANALANRLRENGVPEEMIGGMVQAQSQHFGPQWEAQAEAARNSIVTGKGTASQISLAKRALGAVQAHTPQGQYAQYAGRSPEEQAAAQKKYGDNADFNLTPAGQQNYRAQRVMEFFDASRPDYGPASGWSQTWRLVGGPLASFGAAENAVYGGKKTSDGNWLEDYRLLNQPGGKYEYAANAADRSRFDDSGEYNVYTPDGQPKYPSMSLYNPQGIVDAGFMNSSYPLGYATNAMVGNRQWGDFVGTAMEKGLGYAKDRSDAIRDLRTQGFRITPHTIPGVSNEDMQKGTAEIRRNDAGSDAFASATLGPSLSKATGTKPSYLSPFMSAATNVLGDTVSDPINLGFQVAAPGLSAANAAAKAAFSGGKTMIPQLSSMAKAGAKAYGKGAAKAFGNVGGDTAEEVAESGVFGAMSGLGEMFSPQKDNALIDNYGNGKQPGEDGYSAFDANVNRVEAGTEAAQPIMEARKRARAKPTSMDYQRPPAAGRMMY